MATLKSRTTVMGAGGIRIQTCLHCGAENPEENGYCAQCHGLLEPLEGPRLPPLGPDHAYLVWDRWPWAMLRTVTQSPEQFVASMAIQAAATVVMLVLVAMGVGIAYGPIAAGMADVGLAAFVVAADYARWKAGRRGAGWYARNHL